MKLTSSSGSTPPVQISWNTLPPDAESRPGAENASASEWLGGSSSRFSSRRLRVNPPVRVGVGAPFAGLRALRGGEGAENAVSRSRFGGRSAVEVGRKMVWKEAKGVVKQTYRACAVVGLAEAAGPSSREVRHWPHSQVCSHSQKLRPSSQKSCACNTDPINTRGSWARKDAPRGAARAGLPASLLLEVDTLEVEAGAAGAASPVLVVQALALSVGAWVSGSKHPRSGAAHLDGATRGAGLVGHLGRLARARCRVRSRGCRRGCHHWGRRGVAHLAASAAGDPVCREFRSSDEGAGVCQRDWRAVWYGAQGVNSKSGGCCGEEQELVGSGCVGTSGGMTSITLRADLLAIKEVPFELLDY